MATTGPVSEISQVDENSIMTLRRLTRAHVFDETWKERFRAEIGVVFLEVILGGMNELPIEDNFESEFEIKNDYRIYLTRRQV
jgi:hypothetical protein